MIADVEPGSVRRKGRPRAPGRRSRRWPAGRWPRSSRRSGYLFTAAEAKEPVSIAVVDSGGTARTVTLDGPPGHSLPVHPDATL